MAVTGQHPIIALLYYCISVHIVYTWRHDSDVASRLTLFLTLMSLMLSYFWNKSKVRTELVYDSIINNLIMTHILV